MSYNLQGDQFQATSGQLNNLYPEIYNDIYPLVVQTANEIISNRYILSDDTMNTLVDNIIKMSGMWDEDEETAYSFDEAAPVQFGFGRQPFRGGRRRHNRFTLRDLIRILLLREIIR